MMSAVLTRFVPSVWSRVLLLVGAVVGVVWIVLATSMVFLQDVQREYSSLANSRMPRLAMSSRIDADNARLSDVWTSILGGDLSSTQAGIEVEEVISDLTNSLTMIDEDRENSDLVYVIEEIKQELNELAVSIENLNRYSEQIEASTSRLWWLNLDVQEEVRFIDDDLELSVDAALTRFLTSSDPFEQRELVQRIQAELSLHDGMSHLGEEISRSIALMVQGGSASSELQLVQYLDLGRHAFRRIEELLSPVEEEASFLTLIQTVDAIREIGYEDDGIYALRRKLLGEEAEFAASLSGAQRKFRLLREKLSSIGEKERTTIYRLIDASATDLGDSVKLVLLLTLLSGLIGVWVLFGYIHRRMVGPLGELSRAMLALSEGETTVRVRHQGDDEIGRLANAVRAFQKSVLDRQEAFERLRVTQTQLVQTGKMASLGSLSAGIAHELNQPLAALKHRMHVLDGEFRDSGSSRVTRQLDLIAGLVSRMENTILQLRRFARRSDFASESLRLVTLIDNAITIVAGRLEAGGIELSVERECRNVRIVGDSTLVEQILVNLLSNAIDAIMEVGIHGRIDIAVCEEADVVVLEIVDSGIGLQGLEPGQAIDPFVTTKEVGVGLGLGLSISYNIIKDMGGDLWLEKLLPKGTKAVLVMRKGG